MLLVISPAKTLNFDDPSMAQKFSEPEMLADAERIMQALCKKSAKKLMQLQGISQNLAELNYGRNQTWSTNNDDYNSKVAMSAFQGDVYVGLGESDFSQEDYAFAQDHMRILSGLYGILKPLDRIQPYRLEMGTALKNSRGKNLYEFWKLRITDKVNETLEGHNEQVLINLASDEYFKSIKSNKVSARIVQPVFMDKKNGKYKVLSFFAKKARGMMARFIIKNQIDSLEDIKSFDAEGYLYNSELSSEDKWVFTRDQE